MHGLNIRVAVSQDTEQARCAPQQRRRQKALLAFSAVTSNCRGTPTEEATFDKSGCWAKQGLPVGNKLFTLRANRIQIARSKDLLSSRLDHSSARYKAVSDGWSQAVHRERRRKDLAGDCCGRETAGSVYQGANQTSMEKAGILAKLLSPFQREHPAALVGSYHFDAAPPVELR